MKYVILAAAFVSLISVSSCAKRESLSNASGDTTQRVLTQSTGISVNAVAGDKELLRQALVLADAKGTLQQALTEAAQDSVVGPKMRAAIVLSGDARRMTTTAPTTTKTGSGTTAHHVTTTKSTTTTTQKQDALDKANSGLDKANETVTKSGEVLQKTQQVGNKVGDILNNRH